MTVEKDKLAAIAGGEPAGERGQKMPTGRRGARAVAVQALFESDFTHQPVAGVVERIALQSRLPEQYAAFARDLAGYVEGRRDEIDAMIGKVATAFPTAQMAAVDRNVLRTALAEVKLHPDTPKAVVIDEAVEIARLFGSDSSGRFVHGALGALLR